MVSQLAKVCGDAMIFERPSTPTPYMSETSDVSVIDSSDDNIKVDEVTEDDEDDDDDEDNEDVIVVVSQPRVSVINFLRIFSDRDHRKSLPKWRARYTRRVNIMEALPEDSSEE
jgi:hypothetical protein